MKEPKKILVDFGGTIIRDDMLFDQITEKSGNMKHKWSSPKSWDKIRHIGDKNFFDKVKDKFFMMGDEYPGVMSAMSEFYGENGLGSHSEIYVVYDNKPELYKTQDVTLTRFAFAMSNRGLKFNGLYVERDKLHLTKQIRASILVDDDPRVAIGCALAGIKVVLMMRKWNRFFDIDRLEFSMREDNLEKVKENIVIVEDWFEAEIAISSIIDEDIV